MQTTDLDWTTQPDAVLVTALKNGYRRAHDALVNRYDAYMSEVIMGLTQNDQPDHLRLSLLMPYWIWQGKEAIPLAYTTPGKQFGPYLKGMILKKFLHFGNHRPAGVTILLEELLTAYSTVRN